jgi:signal transduction histidine kinase
VTGSLQTNRSLARTFLLLVLQISLFAVILAVAAMVAWDLRLYRRTWIGDLASQAELIGSVSSSALKFGDREAAREYLGLLKYRPRMLEAAIYDSRGARFATYVRDGLQPTLPDRPGPEGVRDDDGDLIAFQRIVDGGEILGTIYIRARHDIRSRLLGYSGIGLVVTALAMAASFLLWRRLQRRVVGPIQDVARVARDVVSLSDYSRRAPIVSDDEVGLMAHSFNSMLDVVERRTSDLEAANAKLGKEVEARAAAQEEILRLNAGLEDTVLRRTEQLTVAVKELESFCHSVSHDLRAPLRAIHGFSQALAGDFSEALPEQAHRFLARIMSSAARMEQLIEDLLNLSKVHRSDLSRQRVDVSQLAREVAASIRAAEPARTVDIEVWSDLEAFADARLLRSALENLLGNAWKFTSKSEHARIEVGSMSDDGKKVFYVRDNGAGFDMRYADKLFGVFQRLHRMDEFPGTGIGLATVARIVARHGGRVWAEGRVGQGAAFYFTLGDGAPAGVRES